MSIKVQIIEIATNKVIKEIVASNMRSAERVEDGVMINLNHDEYMTQIVEE